MKNIPCTDGIIYNSMKRHRIKLMWRIIVLALVLLTYFLLNRAYILNVIFGSIKLDGVRFVKEAKTYTVLYDEAMVSDASHIIRSYSVKSSSYWQDDKYEFSVPLSDVAETPISYTTRNTGDNYSKTDDKGVLSAKLYTAKVEGINVIVLSYPHQDVLNFESIDGIFTEIPPVIAADFASLGAYEGQEFCKYMLDTRGLEMGSERFDITVSLMLLLLILYLSVKLCIYYINPYFTPTYRALDKYGDVDTVIQDIEAQLKAKGILKIKGRKSYHTDDWIVSEDSFKLKILRNHAKPQDSSRYGSKF